jgi:hypothetical protein
VRVTGDDHLRLGDRVDDLVVFSENRAYMRMAHRRCSALVLVPREGRFVCSVYDVRPQTCRDLARGSGACLGEIAAKEGRPLAAIALS